MSISIRQPPDMQVVTKGWWTLKTERKSVEELEIEDKAAELGISIKELEARMDRLEKLQRSMPSCPACNSKQVQLADRFATPAVWRCRERNCRHQFECEP